MYERVRRPEAEIGHFFRAHIVQADIFSALFLVRACRCTLDANVGSCVSKSCFIFYISLPNHKRSEQAVDVVSQTIV